MDLIGEHPTLYTYKIQHRHEFTLKVQNTLCNSPGDFFQAIFLVSDVSPEGNGLFYIFVELSCGRGCRWIPEGRSRTIGWNSVETWLSLMWEGNRWPSGQPNNRAGCLVRHGASCHRWCSNRRWKTSVKDAIITKPRGCWITSPVRSLIVFSIWNFIGNPRLWWPCHVQGTMHLPDQILSDLE